MRNKWSIINLLSLGLHRLSSKLIRASGAVVSVSSQPHYNGSDEGTMHVYNCIWQSILFLSSLLHMYIHTWVFMWTTLSSLNEWTKMRCILLRRYPTVTFDLATFWRTASGAINLRVDTNWRSVKAIHIDEQKVRRDRSSCMEYVNVVQTKLCVLETKRWIRMHPMVYNSNTTNSTTALLAYLDTPYVAMLRVLLYDERPLTLIGQSVLTPMTTEELERIGWHFELCSRNYFCWRWRCMQHWPSWPRPWIDDTHPFVAIEFGWSAVPFEFIGKAPFTQPSV